MIDYSLFLALTGKRILLVGSGNSALDLTESLRNHGLKSLHMSWRSIPPIVPRQWGILGVECLSYYLLQYLPAELSDGIVLCFYRFLNGSSYTYHLPGQQLYPNWYPYSAGKVPPIDKGTFVQGVRDKSIIIHADISHAAGNRIYFENKPLIDGNICNDHIEVDTIVLCTGYTEGLDWLHLESNLKSDRDNKDLRFLSEKDIISNDTMSDDIELNTIGRDAIAKEYFEKSRLAHESSTDPSVRDDACFFVGYSMGCSLLPLIAANKTAKDIATFIASRHKT